ncbi:DGQHR domain-containing protein [Yersinia intermedia]|uniref:DGQHR domain-containing protein n=1 Tax=Yersinia intermedia TaxID=631 RepID=UPI0005DA7631|nr:DGQHR domain-containing protein [Yersinia intermedia]CNB54434.1 DNA phosphorothioation-associated DGQHR protein 1 [Yersinia intermedia]CRF12994.1 DNA phosphorothioation-associated DGQHR protein 1 [Yersinia intermedia]
MSENIIIHALKISQPYGDFFQAVISADDLLRCTYVNQAQVEDGEISGVQRKESTPRALDIAKFIDSDEAAFPNSIILSVNYDENDTPASEENKWKFDRVDDVLYKITIPNVNLKLCSVIDGQHRLLGFRYSNNKKIQLPCSIYDALPPSGQASIFSTINFNQQKVPKSLAYRLFGYSLDDISRDYWPPDLLAVYFSEKFNSTEASPFYNRLKNRVLNEETEKDWSISSSVFIDGVLTLISKNPRSDRYTINAINSKDKGKGRTRLITPNTKDISPLRKIYINGNDRAIEQVLTMFFKAVQKNFWTDECIREQTLLIRTIGISALFQFLRSKLINMDEISMVNLDNLCLALGKVDPKEFTKKDIYQSTSVGKKKIYDFLIENVKV